MLPPDLLQQSGETLAGHISYVELDPVDARSDFQSAKTPRRSA